MPKKKADKSISSKKTKIKTNKKTDKSSNLEKKVKATQKDKASTGSKIDKKHIFGSSPAEKRFMVANGRLLNDLKDLAEALEEMGEDTYYHHVNDARNDFSNWIGEVLKEKDLAEKMGGIRSRIEAKACVLKHIVGKIEKFIR